MTDARGNILKRHRTVASYDMKDGDKVYLIKSKFLPYEPFVLCI